MTTTTVTTLSGSATGPLIIEHEIVVSQSSVASVGSDEAGLITSATRGRQSTLRIEPGATGFQEGLVTAVVLNEDVDIGASDIIGHVVMVQSKGNGGIGGIYGSNVGAFARAGANHSNVVGVNPEVGLFQGAEALYRAGFRAQTWGDKLADTSDAAYTIASSNGSAWGNGFVLNEFGEAQSIAADGSLFKSNAPITLKKIFDLSNVSVTDSIIDHPKVHLTGDGAMYVADHFVKGVRPGEYKGTSKPTSAPTALTSGTPVNMAPCITLTEGEWDVSFLANFQCGVSSNVKILLANISVNSNALDTTAGRLAVSSYGTAGVVHLDYLDISVSVPRHRVVVPSGATLPLYPVVRATYTGGGMSAWGEMSARRIY